MNKLEAELSVLPVWNSHFSLRITELLKYRMFKISKRKPCNLYNIITSWYFLIILQFLVIKINMNKSANIFILVACKLLWSHCSKQKLVPVFKHSDLHETLWLNILSIKNLNIRYNSYTKHLTFKKIECVNLHLTLF